MAKTIARFIDELMLASYTYNPETGICKGYNGNKQHLHNQGYYNLWKDMNKKRYRMYAHRFAFLFMTGSIPDEIDHIDGKQGNNRWENLRACSKSDNIANRKGTGKFPKNITQRREGDPYRVRIMKGGKEVFDKRFKELDLAELVATEAREKFHGKFAYKETT